MRAPAGTVADTARRAIETSIPDLLDDPFFREIEDEAVEAWKSNKTFLGLAVQQVETFITILQLAYGVVHLTGRDIDHRTFSRRTVKDSKALERWEGRVGMSLSLLK
jgi:hypothetical protein